MIQMNKFICNLLSRGTSIRAKISSKYSLAPMNFIFLRLGRIECVSGGGSGLSRAGRDWKIKVKGLEAIQRREASAHRLGWDFPSKIKINISYDRERSDENEAHFLLVELSRGKSVSYKNVIYVVHISN